MTPTSDTTPSPDTLIRDGEIVLVVLPMEPAPDANARRMRAFERLSAAAARRRSSIGA